MNKLYIEFSKDNSLTQHEFMGEFVEALGHSLAAWDFHKQPMSYYIDLSWGGLENSSTYKALSQNKKDKIQRIIRAERYGYNSAKGEKCP